jgi:hypothetical protein
MRTPEGFLNPNLLCSEGANSNLSVLRMCEQLGAGFDICLKR